MKRSKLSSSDEWETPQELFYFLCTKYNIFPDTDVCATNHNSKCIGYIDKEMDCLKHDFQYHNKGLWCNPPHSLNEEFVRKMYKQWKKYNIPIIMIIPANTMSSNYWHECIEGIAETHSIKGRIRFLYEGKPAKDVSRNAYVCVIWRRKNEIQK